MDKIVPRVPVMNGTQTASEWFRFFQSLVRRSKDAPVSLTVGASPVALTISNDGVLFIVGGTVSQVNLTRYGNSFNCGANANPIIVRTGDIVTITYTVAPVVQFLAD